MRRTLIAFVVLIACIGSFACMRPAAAAAPVISHSGLSPANSQDGATIHIWMTYSDADNDPPTYVRLVRILPPATTQTPTYNLVANDSGTNYITGKTYHYDYYYFPFTGTGWIQLQVKSGTDGQVTKNLVEYQEPLPTLTYQGVTPVSNLTGAFTFFVNYTQVFNYAPSYMTVLIDGVNHTMTKNNSADVTYIDGVNYSYTVNLSAGNHTFSFHAKSSTTLLSDFTTGSYWFQIRANSIYLAWISVGGGTTGGLAFTSSPGLTVEPDQRYNYTPTWVNSGSTLTLTTTASWLVLLNGTITGRPTSDEVGVYLIELMFSNATAHAYQNYSLDVGWKQTTTPYARSGMILGLVFGFGLIVVGVIDPERKIWTTYAGFIWLGLGVVVFYPFGLIWLFASVGIGLILMLEGTKGYAAGREGG